MWLSRILIAGFMVYGLGLGAAKAACDPASESLALSDGAGLLCWHRNGDRVVFRMEYDGRRWLALGLGKAMAGADVAIAGPGLAPADYHLTGREAQDVRRDAIDDLIEPAFTAEGGRSVLTFMRPLQPGDASDAVIDPQAEIALIWAVGPQLEPGEAAALEFHEEHGLLRIHLAGGGTAGSDFPWLALHGWLMVLGWGLLLPAGIVVSRFFKVTPGQDFPRELANRFWWNWHRLLQYSGVAVVVIAAGLPLTQPGWQWSGSLHGSLGALVIALAVFQVINAQLRGTRGGPEDEFGRPNPPEAIAGDHYEMTVRRRVFEAVHIVTGYLALLGAGFAVALGLWLLGWPTGLTVCAGLCLLLFVALFVALQSRGAPVGSYNAIWGYDSIHPGNRHFAAPAERDG